MKLSYYPDTDSLYTDLSSRPNVTCREISEGIIFDYDDDDNIVGLNINNASKKLGLRELIIAYLPVTAQNPSA